MSHDAWLFAGTLVTTAGTLVSAVAVAYFKLRGQVTAAKHEAAQAKTYAQPTGNGFAANVLSALNEIRKDQRAMREEAAADRAVLIGHLQDHSREHRITIPRQRGDYSPSTDPMEP